MAFDFKDWRYEYVNLPKINSDEDIDAYVEAAERYFPKWTRKNYSRIEVPTLDNPIAQQNWEFEQIRRCIEGHDGLPGKMYFYFHFCTIRNISGGFINPDLRVSDAVWFHLLESCELGNYNQGKGIICVKRRRAGFSWKQAADSLHDALFKKGFRVGMTSKDEDAAKDLLKKVYQMYERLPTFLKHPFSSKTQDSFVLARKSEDELGQRSLSGNESEIYSKAPTDSCFEGEQIGKMVIDEAGKIANLETIYSMGQPTLMEETVRVGIPILFGTAGEQEKVGVGQKAFWKDNDVYGFERFFFPGWAGMMCDESGNDDIRASVEYILGERAKLAKLDDDQKMLEYQQQYPLYAEEAFLSKGATGVGNQRRIAERISELEENEPRKVKGKFRLGRGDENIVVFEPNDQYDNSGQCTVYEHPNKGLEYVAGCDPSDHSYVQNGASNLSMYIMSKQRGTHAPRIVFSYTDRPDKVNDYYEQAILAAMYYNGVKILIENNRVGMIKYFEDNGYFHLLKPEPIARGKMTKVSTKQMGIRATKNTKQEMERVINQYTNDHCHLVPDIEVLKECQLYGEANVDRVFAWGWCLVSLEDEHISASTRERIASALPKTKLVRNSSGKLVRMRK